MNKKIKVVLLSQYWSDEMAEIVGRKHYFRELAPWIQETINLFKGKNDIEFHVVAPNYAANKNVYTLRDNIHYHYYHYAPKLFSYLTEPIIRHVYNHAEPFKLAERLGNVLSAYSVPTRNAVRIINRIHPDIIHLFGSEAPDYSKAAYRLMNKYPLILSVQGYAYLMEDTGNLFEKVFHWYMAKYEEKINRNIKYRIVPRLMTKEEAIIPEKHFFEKCERLYVKNPITRIPSLDAYNEVKKYDVVYYARIVKDKGIEDLIEALLRLKQQGRVLSAIIMGRGNETYVDMIKRMIESRDLEEQIKFVGFVERHADVYKMASQAKVLVLPTYQDGINNTVREAMFMRLPIIAYNVDLLNRANNHRQCIHFVEKGNIDELATGMCKVLDDENYRKQIIDNSYQEAQEYYTLDAIYGQMIGAYKDLLDYLNSNIT